MRDMYPEMQMIPELCKLEGHDGALLECLLKGGVDQPYILSRLLAHRLCGLAYSVLQSSGLLQAFSPTFQCALTTAYHVNVQRATGYREALNQLAKILSHAEIKYALLKGAYLNGIYPLGLRVSNDVDILTQDISGISRLLACNGFTQGYMRDGVLKQASRAEVLNARMNRGETVPFFKRVDLPKMEFLEVDVNFSTDHQARGRGDLVSSMLAQAEPLVDTPSGKLKTLTPVHFLIHLCAHLYKEATQMAWVRRRRDIGLYKHVDILTLVNAWMDNAFADRLSKEITRFELHEPCYYALRQTKELFDIQNVHLDRVLAAGKPKDEGILQRVYEPEAQRTFEYISSLEYKEALLDRVFSADRIKQLKEVHL